MSGVSSRDSMDQFWGPTMSSSDVLGGLKPIIELVAEMAMWKQKAADLEKERDYLRERLAYLEKVVAERNGS